MIGNLSFFFIFNIIIHRVNYLTYLLVLYTERTMIFIMSKELDLGRVVGKDATINGQNAIQLIAGKDINISQEGGNVTVAVSDDLNAVPKERMINNKPLSEDIALSASDVGAAAASHGIHVTYADTSPKMDGTAAVGTDTKLARADHVHPHDTSKQDKLTGTPDQYVTFDENGNAVAKQKDYSLFGFQINPDESDPSKIIKYIAQNASYDPAFMDYTKDEFNYGDWSDAWFIKNIKVVMMNNDGTINCELNRDNYSFYANKNAALDLSNESTDRNVMVGIPTVWVRHVKINGKDTFYFSDQKLSDNFHAYAHTDANGNIIPYAYMAAYNGYKDNNGKMRSLSGKTPTIHNSYGSSPSSISEVLNSVYANNPGGKHMWDINIYADRNLINLLLLLIGKSTDTQTTFGNGNMNGYTNPADGSGENGVLPTGTMNDKGLFWGSNADNLGVKV